MSVLKKHFIGAFAVLVCSCASINKMTSPSASDVLPRYISPIKYLEYSCARLKKAEEEAKSKTYYFVHYDRTGLGVGGAVPKGKSLAPRSTYYVDVEYLNTHEKIVEFSLSGVSELKGHLAAIEKTLAYKSCH